jgi:hypothetical protein
MKERSLLVIVKLDGSREKQRRVFLTCHPSKAADAFREQLQRDLQRPIDGLQFATEGGYLIDDMNSYLCDEKEPFVRVREPGMRGVGAPIIVSKACPPTAQVSVYEGLDRMRDWRTVNRLRMVQAATLTWPPVAAGDGEHDECLSE